MFVREILAGVLSECDEALAGLDRAREDEWNAKAAPGAPRSGEQQPAAALVEERACYTFSRSLLRWLHGRID